MKAKEKPSDSKLETSERHTVEMFDDKIKAVQRRLKDKAKSSAAPARRTKMDVIRASFAHIEALWKKGFCAEEIAAEITEVGGFDISAGTLKNYMHRIRVERDRQPYPAPRTANKQKLEKVAAGTKKETVPRARAPTPVQQKETTQETNHGGKFHIKPDRTNL